MKRRVVVTGVGMVTPLGLSAQATWGNLIAGRSGIETISLFDAGGFPSKIAGEVRGFDFNRWKIKDPALRDAGRGTFFALEAAEEAFRDSRLRLFNVKSERFGLYFGAGDSGQDFDAFVNTIASSWNDDGSLNREKYVQSSLNIMSPMRELEHQPFMTLTHLARHFDIRGPVANSLTACAASSQAIGEAYEWIKGGAADIVMSGGSHSMIYPLGVAGFSLLTVLSKRNDEPHKASRPFEKNRDGFVMAEGAGVMILEELSHALKRRAKIYGEIVGYGSTADAYRLTDMDPEGKSGAEAIRQALEKGSLSYKDIDYISAHGTSTSVNDLTETVVIKKVFKDKAKDIPVSSIKSMLGHMIASAGVVEAIVCFQAMRDSAVPPTINFDEPDPDCDLDYVPNKARRMAVHTAVSNSFGFGGQNICLAMRRYDH